MNRIKLNKNLKKLLNPLRFILVLLLIVNFLSVQISANAIFNLMGLVDYSSGSGAQIGNASTANSFANARAYRSNVDGNITDSNEPTDGRIYSAGLTDINDPGYFLFDVGSSAWNPAPTVGDTAMVVLETRAGLNGWNGPTYVSGVKSTITQNDLNANGIDYSNTNAVMEQIPTPVYYNNSLSSISFRWTGLWDNSIAANGGTSNNSIIGYSVYRSDNSAAYQFIGSIAQSAGQTITYTDSSATINHSYTYKIKVQFEWSAHNPSYYESVGFGGESSAMVTQNPNPDRVVFTSTPQTINAGNKSAIITIQARDVDGNVTPLLSDTTIELTSNSTGPNKSFYNVSAGLCGSTVITTVQILTGSSSAQFCYYDDVVSPSVWVLRAHKSAPAGTWVDGTQNIAVHHSSLDHFNLSLASPQYNNLAFTGTNTITAYDQYNNLINDFDASTDNITFSVNPDDGVISGFGGGNKITSGLFSNGSANLTGLFKFTGTSGDHVFTATSDSGKVANSGTIFITPATATHLSFSAPSNVTAGSQFSLSSISALDEFENVDTNFNGTKLVTFSGASNSLLAQSPSFTTSVTFENGISTTNLLTTLVRAETITLTATTQLLSGESNSITVDANTASHFVVTAPNTAIAGESFNITSIQAYDAYGNLDPNYSGQKQLNYSGPGNGPDAGVPSYTTTVDFTNGASVTTLETTLFKREGTAITVSDGSIAGSTSGINVQAADAASIEYVSGNDQTARINTFVPLTLIVRVKDIFGNLKDNSEVQFVVTKSNGFVSVTNPLTAANGTAQTNFSLGSTAGDNSDQVEARVLGASGSPIIFNATATQLVATNLVVTAPNTATAGVPFNLIISVTDQNGNPYTDFNGIKTINYSGANSSPNLTAPSYTTSVTFTDGVAINIATTLVKVENVVLSLSIPANNVSGTSNAIQVNPAATSRFIAVAPANVTSGVSFNLTSLTAIDAYANTTPSYSGTKNLVYTGAGVDPISHNGPSYTTTVSFTNGLATTALVTTLYKAENVNLTIKDGSIQGTTNTISVTYSQPYIMYYVSGNNQTGAVGQQLANPLVVVLLNNQGFPALDRTVVFTVITGAGSVTLPATFNSLTGEWSTHWSLGTTVGVQSVTATAVGVVDTVGFNANAVADAASTIIITPSSISTFATHATNDINLCLKDQYGNQVVTNFTRSINLSSDSFSGEFSYDVSGPWGMTTADIQTGQSCVKINYLDSVAGNYIFTASSAGLTSASIPIDVQALIPTQITINPQAFTISESSTKQMAATVFDQFGIAMSNISLLWEMADNSAGSIDSNGLFTPAHNEGTFTNAIKVSYSNLSAYSTPTITLDTIPPVATSIVISPENFTINENSTQQMVATVYDQFNQPMSGLTLVWSITNNAAGSINSSGLYTPSHTAGTYSNAIQVSYSSLNAFATPTITIVEVESVATSITISPTAFSINENSTQQMTATVYDQFNQPMSNLTLTWSMNSINAGSINSSGLYTPSHTAGTFTNAIKVSYLGLSAYATPTITVTNVTPIASTIIISPVNFTINVSSSRQMIASVYDQLGQKMTNTTITWSVENGNAGSINASGVFTPGKNTQTYANVIKASYLSLSAFATVTITTEPIVEVPTQPTTPTIPTTPTTPTVPIVVEVDQNYYSNNSGNVPITVEVPAVTILTPKNGMVILSNGKINIAGNSAPEEIILVKDERNNILGSVTSDKNGYWKVYVSRNKFGTESGTIVATNFKTNATTAPITFNFPKRSVGEYILDLIFSN